MCFIALVGLLLCSSLHYEYRIFGAVFLYVSFTSVDVCDVFSLGSAVTSLYSFIDLRCRFLFFNLWCFAFVNFLVWCSSHFCWSAPEFFVVSVYWFWVVWV